MSENPEEQKENSAEQGETKTEVEKKTTSDQPQSPSISTPTELNSVPVQNPENLPPLNPSTENVTDPSSVAPPPPPGVAVGSEGTPGVLSPPQPEFKPEISAELEKKIQEELAKKREQQGIRTITREEFISTLQPRRTKIMYHALWHLTFNVDDHQATKQGLYEALKEVTSMSPVEPIAEHKFYFGLKSILKLKLFDAQVIEYVKDKIKLAINVENLQEILREIGEPISTRPKLSDDEKKNMYSNFLTDEFKDI